MSRAEDLFARIEVGGEAYIDELIDTRKSEESFLDFKRSANHGGSPRLHPDDLKNLSRSLSGFSNSEGGVVIWGSTVRVIRPSVTWPGQRCPCKTLRDS